MNLFHTEKKYVFGGYHRDPLLRYESTSGGAFTAIAETFCDENYIIFGAEAKGLTVFHSFISNKGELQRFRKSKYSQSRMGSCYRDCKTFLEAGKKVLFSGTPCQIAGLRQFLRLSHADTAALLTVEVVCEGVPSPLYMEKYQDALFQKYHQKIEQLDYRYTGARFFGRGKWDFEALKVITSKIHHEGKWDFQSMRTKLISQPKQIILDRWFNPFWSIWLNHLMSRPSCYECPFARQERTADITLGDLWGVHLYCPELYGNNFGSSLILANSPKGISLLKKARSRLYGHPLDFTEALRYQSPLRKPIDRNPDRAHFMQDLRSGMSYAAINRKWAKKPGFRLLWQKYIWGNQQKINVWYLKNRLFRKGDRVKNA